MVGNWNPAIFTPQWVSSKLTTSQNISVEIRLAPRTIARLNFDSLLLYLGDQRLTLAPQDSGDDVLERMQRVAEQILTELSHTPIQAVGVNFQFADEGPSDSVLGVFDLADTTALANAGAAVEATTVTRRLSVGPDLLNLTLAHDNGTVRVDLNFHKDVENAEQARAHISRGVVSFRQQAFNILGALHEWRIEGT